MSSKARLFAIIALALAALIAPNLVLSEAPAAAGMLGLGGLGFVLATLAAGLRIGVLAALLVGAASGIAVASSAVVAIGVLVMVATAIGLGVSARWHWNRAFIALPITVAFIVAEDPSQDPLASGFAFGAAMAGYGLVVAVISSPLRPRKRIGDGEPVSDPASWSRTWGYTSVLAVTTAATSAIALTFDWGHTGGWLMMTPFIVIQPYIQDGWRKAFSRTLGTVGGFLIAYLLGELLGSGDLLTAFGVAFGVLAVTAMVERWPYAVYATLLTPAIVILESIGRPIQTTDNNRLVATVLGVALALLAMAVATPLYRFQARRYGLDHY